MKNILKYLSVAVLLVFSSCDLTELDYLDSPNGVSPENAETQFIFFAAELDLEDFFNTMTFNTMRPVRMLPMTGGNIYNNAFSSTTFDFAWRKAYADLLPDLDAIIASAEKEGSEVPIYAGAAKVMKSYVLTTLVDVFGNVPYSEAGQGVVNKSPKADNSQDVYNVALALLDDAIKDLSGPQVEIKAEQDLFYEGKPEKWLALANTLKLRWYVNTRLVADHTSDINALVNNVIQDKDGDFQFNYTNNLRNVMNGDGGDSRHPFYINQYESGSGVYQSNYYMWSLAEEKGIVDPRLRYYFFRQDAHPEEADAFTLDCNTQPRPIHYTGPYPFCAVYDGFGYWGRDHGDNAGIPPDGDRRTVFGLYPGGGKFDSDEGLAGKVSVKNGGKDGAAGEGIAPIMLSSFTKFMLAEAALTMGTTGDPRAYLEEGVRQSIEKVMSFGEKDAGADVNLFPSNDDVEAYVAKVLELYDNAGSTNDKLDVILKEYHIALWGNGIEAYNFYRRTGLPSGMQPTREPSSGDFPRLMFYPSSYVNLNENASQKAITEQVFWDNNPAGFIN
ncbi:MAG TPA: SusD/RagB family nutrient-binding outer membrane lipoprotein [Bacteroidetes bacterium]|nr:SusD/RagB family nutrient-binding outer membrane lipoprotein [Bacteroidota bacterium]